MKILLILFNINIYFFGGGGTNYFIDKHNWIMIKNDLNDS